MGSSDIGEFFVLPSMAAILAAEAPGVQVTFRNPQRGAFDEMEQGTLDLMVGAPPPDRAGFRATSLGEEPYVVVSRPDHPILTGPEVLLADYLRCRHLLIAPTGQPGGVVDGVLGALGYRRQVVVQVSHFLSAPFIAASSDLVLTCPEGLARRAAELTPLEILPPPLSLPPSSVWMVWHERSHRDAGHRWLRDKARDLTLATFSSLRPRSG